MKNHADVIIVGTGAAGLFCALKLPQNLRIIMITKDEAENSDSFLAQGGICMLKSPEDYKSYYEDTMKAGHYQNDPQAVSMMINSSPHIIDELVRYGVDFRHEGSEFAFFLDDDGFAYIGKVIQMILDFFRVDVLTTGTENHVFTASLDEKIAFLVNQSEVSRA